jgi:phosphohistidine phosphatase
MINRNGSMLENLWIMRHGLAESQFESDFTRPLSKVGVLQTENTISQLMANSDVLPTQMLASPLARTQSTAKIAHLKLNLQQPFKTDSSLVHSADHRLLGDYLLASDYQNLIIVSHMPVVAYLVQYLVPQSEMMGFQTAQIAHLAFDRKNQQAQVQNVYRANI